MWPVADHEALFTSDIANEMVIMSSEGSVKGGHRSTGWTLTIQTGLMTSDEIQKGAAPVDCNPAEQSSTRCKLSGVLAGLTAVDRVTLGQVKVTITAGCDSAGAMSEIFKWSHTRQATRRMQGGRMVISYGRYGKSSNGSHT